MNHLNVPRVGGPFLRTLTLLSAVFVSACGGGGGGGGAVAGGATSANVVGGINSTPSAPVTAIRGPALVAGAASGSTGGMTPVTPTPSAPPAFSGYEVRGNMVYDKSTNQAHLFRGVAAPSMSWQVNCDHCSLGDFQMMSQGWKTNVVRLSVTPSFWLPSSPRYNAGYAAEVARVVATIEQAGMDIILDCHDSSSPYMADADTVTFWREVATAYRGDPHVLFELFNEPNQISWDLWLNGGTAPSGPPIHGMQELYNTVRSTGATNLVVISGLNWAYELADVPTHRVVGNNIMYNTHPYNFPGKQPDDWDRGFGELAKTDPIIATEFGSFDCTKPYYQAFVDYARAHHISWTAWAWFPGGCGFPALLTDWNGTTTPPGDVVKAALLNP